MRKVGSGMMGAEALLIEGESKQFFGITLPGVRGQGPGRAGWQLRYRVRGAERDWQAAAGVLLAAGAYSQCIFFTHLTVKNMKKAHRIKEHEDPDPPMGHNIAKLLQQTLECTGIVVA